MISNRTGVYFYDDASTNKMVGNQIKNSRDYGIYTKVKRENSNLISSNFLYKNRKDIAGVSDKVTVSASASEEPAKQNFKVYKDLLEFLF